MITLTYSCLPRNHRNGLSNSFDGTLGFTGGDGELVWKRIRSMRPAFERKRARSGRRDGKRPSIDRKRHMEKEKDSVVPSESPLAKTRPGLRILVRAHRVAIMQLRRRVCRRLLAHRIAPGQRAASSFLPRNLRSKSLKLFELHRSRDESSRHCFRRLATIH